MGKGVEHLSKRGGIHRHGSANQEAEHGHGYAASGESQYSRNSAHGQLYRERRDDGPSYSVAETLARAIKDLETYQRRILRPTNSADQADKLQKSIALKTATIERLRGEL